MKDLITKGSGDSRFLKSAVPEGCTWEQALALLRAGIFPIDFNGLNAAGITQMPTPLNGANLLGRKTAAAIGLESDDPTVNEALMKLAGNRKVGDVVLTTQNTLGNNYLLCNGDILDKDAYPLLYTQLKAYSLDTAHIPDNTFGGSQYVNGSVYEYKGYLVKVVGTTTNGITLYYLGSDATQWSSISIPYPSGNTSIATFCSLQLVNDTLCFLLCTNASTFLAFSTDIFNWSYTRVTNMALSSLRITYAFGNYLVFYVSSYTIRFMYTTTLQNDLQSTWNSGNTSTSVPGYIGDIYFDGTYLVIACAGQNENMLYHYTDSLTGSWKTKSQSSYWNVNKIYKAGDYWLFVSCREDTVLYFTNNLATIPSGKTLFKTNSIACSTLLSDNTLLLFYGGTCYQLSLSDHNLANGLLSIDFWTKIPYALAVYMCTGTIVSTYGWGGSTISFAKIAKCLPVVNNLGVYAFIKAKE